MSEPMKTPQEQIAELILKYLAEQFAEEDLYKTIQPRVTITVRIGMEQGVEAATAMLDGLVSGDSYVYWRQAIEAASPEERILIMGSAEQAAYEVRLKDLQAKESWQAFGKVLLEVAIGVAGILLI